MKRLLIFGDSIMRGVYYSAEEGRHKIFSERFNCLKERGFEVINSSRMGATVEMGGSREEEADHACRGHYRDF